MDGNLGNICSCSPNRLDNSFIKYFSPSIASILSFWEYGDNQDVFKVILDPWVTGKSPGGGHGNPIQYSCLGSPMDREVKWVTVHRVAKELDTT